MNTIYKYPLKANAQGRQVLSIPGSFFPLCLKLQDGEPMLWGIVDTDQPMQEYAWYVYYTGMPTRADIHLSMYVGSTMEDGLVSHYFIQFLPPDTPATPDNHPPQ